MPHRTQNALATIQGIDDRLHVVEDAAARELQQLQHTRDTLPDLLSECHKCLFEDPPDADPRCDAMLMKCSKYAEVEPASRGNAIAIGYLLAGICIVAGIMALFAPLDSNSNASTIGLSPTQVSAPR